MREKRFTVFDAAAARCASEAVTQGGADSARMLEEPIAFDRPRKVAFRRVARKPAPMLVLDRLTVKMTVECRDSGKKRVNRERSPDF